jgi:ribosomal protein S18 acetylase RimI-like enzyme
MDYDVRAKSWREQLVPASSRIYVAEMDGIICGFICGGRLREPLSEFDGEIYAIYVDARVQRRGCGKALSRQLAEILLQDGLTSAVVWVLEKNPACGFYARLGGELVARKTITIGGSDLVEVAYGFNNLRLLFDAAK